MRKILGGGEGGWCHTPPIDSQIFRRLMIFHEGGMWDEAGWEVRLNVECDDSYGGIKPCKHCLDIKMVAHENSEKSFSWTQMEWICPRVVVARNEGGCATTGVCMDCIVEASGVVNAS